MAEATLRITEAARSANPEAFKPEGVCRVLNSIRVIVVDRGIALEEADAVAKDELVQNSDNFPGVSVEIRYGIGSCLPWKLVWNWLMGRIPSKRQVDSAVAAIESKLEVHFGDPPGGIEVWPHPTFGESYRRTHN